MTKYGEVPGACEPMSCPQVGDPGDAVRVAMPSAP